MATCFSDFAWICIPFETCQVLANLARVPLRREDVIRRNGFYAFQLRLSSLEGTKRSAIKIWDSPEGNHLFGKMIVIT
jgi:predicted metal-binding transcription factor (methanogenesis marker protein 9)